jgi:hypothetical protein
MEVDVLPHGTAVTVMVLLPKRRLWRSASELLSGNERQITACRRYIHSPSDYAGWAVAMFGRFGTRRAAWLFLDWAFLALAGALWFVSDWFE